ncbi:Immunoglobulin superfamily DCC subclass member 4 [Apostichopus japonicus]|uniref:Immunoglobulin superfamily DCC subclass member 4 n=1 Tax=Stichopus japonicus TaxID=307972 RepID=A0A2G8K6P3_STIJA|nr:Immunoglobulin superfamily DCC subclass member 4 [Apostichopus japonicus]
MDLVRNLQGTAIASDSVSLSWTLPSYSNIIIYGCIVYYASIPDGDELSHYIEYQERSQWNETLGSLRPNANYSISVRVAFDGPGGLSKLSTVYVKTTESVPTAAPEIVNLFSTPTSITVTWKSVDAEHQNGVLTETVACIDQEADNIDARCDEVEQDRTSYTFHNLHPGLEYLVRLAAKTDVGQGPFSEPLPRMTPSKKLHSWVDPTHFRSEVITGFRLMIFRGVDGNRIDFVLLDASARSYNKSNAGQSKTYTVTFYAFGLCGEGPSSTSVFKMPEEITVEVDVPINVQAVSKTWSTIDLTWDAPYLPRQSLSYTVQYGVIGGTHSYWTGPDTHVNLRNLLPYTIYQMKVKVNISGLYSQLMYCRTLESTPGSPPTRLSGYSLGATSLNVTWYPPAVPNGKITYYTVFYCSSKTISKGWHKIILAVSKDHEGMISLELVNLDSGTAYTIKVSANTSVGAGPSTAPIYAETSVANIYAPSNNFADLRSGILTGVCLALLCITVCVSLLVYHHRHTLCYHNDIQCRSSSTRIGTPTHIRGCRGGGRKGCAKPSAYQLSILQTEFEMEDLMKRGRQLTAADRLVLQVHHHREIELPVQGANLDAVPSAEEPFLTIHYSEPPQVDTSQDIPHLIPQEDSGDVQSTSTSRQPEVNHHKANPRPHRAAADVKLDILSEDKRHASYHSLGEGGGEASTSQRRPADSHCRERGGRNAELYSSSSWPATTSEKHRASSSASSTLANTAPPQGRGQTWQGQGQTWQLREKHLRDHVSSSKSSRGAAEGGSIHLCDQSSDTASLDCDSGLSGDLFGDGNGGCDTSPDFLERVLEEMSDNVY